MKKFISSFLFIASIISFSALAQETEVDFRKLKDEKFAQLEKTKSEESHYIKGTPSYAKAIECMEDATYSQPPVNFETGVTANTNEGYEAAHLVENFEYPIQALRFFGIQAFFSGSWNPMNNVDPYDFVINFYANNGGLPGELLKTETATLSHVNTGETFATDYIVYHWDFIPDSPIDNLPATFWIGIANSNTNAWFLWIDQVGGIGATAQYIDGAWNTTDSDGFGLCIVPLLADPDAPAAPTDINVIVGELGVMEATVSWTNPTQTASEEELTELTSVELYVNNILTQTIEDPVIGGPESEFIDLTGELAGSYTFKVVGINSAGEGISVSQTSWVGEDMPASPTNVLLESVDGDGSLTWDEPTEGLNGGYMPGVDSYIIVRSDGVTLENEYTGTQPYVDNTITSPANFYYTITAVNAIGQGGFAASNTELLGVTGETVTVGDGETTDGARIPLDFYWQNSLSQVIYYSEELNFIGEIESIAYFNSFVDDFTDGTAVKIWIGVTEETDLSGGYIPASELTLVYDGNLKIPVGENLIIIPFDEPYFYQGGNLVIMANRPMDTDYFSSSNRWLQTPLSNGDFRALNNNSDGTLFDPYNPPIAAEALSFANTVFFYNESPTIIPNERDFILEDENDVFTTVYWLGATSLEISDDVGDLILDTDYTITDNGDDTALLTISGAYLATKITDINDPALVLTITFDTEDIVEFTIHPALKSVVGVHNPEPLTVLLGTTFIELMLPPTVDVDLNDGTVTTLNVTWSEEDYNQDEAGVYIITGNLNLGTLENPDNIQAEVEVRLKYVASSIIEDFDEHLAGFGNMPPYWDAGRFYIYATGGVNNSQRLSANLYGTTYNLGYWETPLIDIGSNPKFNFMYRIVNWSGYPGTPTPDNHALLEFYASTDFGETFNLVHTIHGSNHTVTTDYAYVEVDLSGYENEYVIIRMQGSRIDGDFYADFDNIKIGTFYTTSFNVVNNDAQPIENAEVSIYLSGETEAAFIGYTNDNGDVSFELNDETDYTYEISTFGYIDESGDFSISGADLHFDIIMTPIPSYSVEGLVKTNDEPDNVFLVGALIELVGYGEYTTTTDVDGYFMLPEVYEGMYSLTISYPGYESYTDNLNVISGLDLGEITLVEIIADPYALAVDVDHAARKALFTWNGAEPWNESFEDGVLPDNWSQIITNTGSGAVGDFTWQITGEVTFSEGGITPQDGNYQAFIMWSYDHQDEWLITPEFIAPQGDLVFWYYGSNGSPNGDNYYVKVSTDGGNNWDILWNASDLPEGENHYAVPAIIDLTTYSGQEIQIAWNNVDGDGEGLWFAWAIDNISVGNQKIDVKDLMHVSNTEPRIGTNPAAKDGLYRNTVNLEDVLPFYKSNKEFLGFNVYLDGSETPANSELIPEITPEYEFTDLTLGIHTAGVEAVFSTGISNTIEIDFEVLESFEITFSVAGNVHGSIYAEVNGETITSGDYVIAESDVVFTANPDEGYLVKEWKLNSVIVENHTELTYSVIGINEDINVTVEFVLETSVNEISLSEIKAFPNPFSDNFTISNAENINRVIITNIIGQRVMDITLNGDNTIITSELNNGVYLVTFESFSGERIIIRMVKQ